MRVILPMVVMLVAACGIDAAPFEATGEVVAASGAVPVRAASACTVGFINEGKGGYPCRVTVICAGQTLYGGERLGGYTRCTAEEGRLVRAWDEWFSWKDGDPWLHLDMRAREVTVKNQRPDSAVVVRFAGVP